MPRVLNKLILMTPDTFHPALSPGQNACFFQFYCSQGFQYSNIFYYVASLMNIFKLWVLVGLSFFVLEKN